MWELLGLAVAIGALAYGVHRLNQRVVARTVAACAEAARVLGLSPVSLARDEAAGIFLAPGRAIHSDVRAFGGTLKGVEVLIAAFTFDSNTMVNGAVIPLTATHVLARLPRPLVGTGLEISRRVFGSSASQVALGDPLDKKAVVLAADPERVGRVLRGDQALGQAIVELLERSQGLAHVYEDRCATMVLHRDAARIRDAVRRVVEVSHAIGQAADARAALR